MNHTDIPVTPHASTVLPQAHAWQRRERRATRPPVRPVKQRRPASRPRTTRARTAPATPSAYTVRCPRWDGCELRLLLHAGTPEEARSRAYWHLYYRGYNLDEFKADHQTMRVGEVIVP